jgi:hypothetical protein
MSLDSSVDIATSYGFDGRFDSRQEHEIYLYSFQTYSRASYSMVKSKAIPVTGRRGLQGCE